MGLSFFAGVTLIRRGLPRMTALRTGCIRIEGHYLVRSYLHWVITGRCLTAFDVAAQNRPHITQLVRRGQLSPALVVKCKPWEALLGVRICRDRCWRRVKSRKLTELLTVDDVNSYGRVVCLIPCIDAVWVRVDLLLH